MNSSPVIPYDELRSRCDVCLTHNPFFVVVTDSSNPTVVDVAHWPRISFVLNTHWNNSFDVFNGISYLFDRFVDCAYDRITTDLPIQYPNVVYCICARVVWHLLFRETNKDVIREVCRIVWNYKNFLILRDGTQYFVCPRYDSISLQLLQLQAKTICPYPAVGT